tara:strand:- start:292 stop:651 length:360 start_codon:yes stop_codon:yes gene_type:complete
MADQPKRIFIVEDETIIAFEMADALEDLGFEVVGPSTHLEHALALAEAEDFDVACLDVNLGPGKTSAPIAQILSDRNIPYVYITAYEPDQIDFVGSDDRVMRKPVSRSELRKMLLKMGK